MSGRKNMLTMVGFVLSVSLIASSLSVMLVSRHYDRLQFHLLNAVCGEVLGQKPETREIILTTLKEYICGNTDNMAEHAVLSTLGYRPSDFSNLNGGQIILFVTAGLLIGMILFFCTFWRRNKMENMRIQALADYLEQVNTGNAAILSAAGEDEFSKLEDEIYKTVTCLYRTKEEAVEARNDFAENLSNIAHQIKTPITAISLSVQTLQKEYGQESFESIQRQLSRLTRLEEALLLLSRLDAGTLVLEMDEIDVFTVLVLAADNLQELFAESGTSVDIQELGEMAVTADLDWTMEALINLMKNCMEHHLGGGDSLLL